MYNILSIISCYKIEYKMKVMFLHHKIIISCEYYISIYPKYPKQMK